MVFTSAAGEMASTVANLRHANSQTVARFMHVRVSSVHPPQEKITISLASRMTDGRRLITTDQPATFDPAPQITLLRKVRGSLEELLEMHRRQLAKWSASATVDRVLTDADLGNFVIQYSCVSRTRHGVGSIPYTELS